MTDSKPFAPAAERNKQAILSVLQNILREDDSVFEFGSGTGQHACHICKCMPELLWQPSDLDHTLAGIRQWIVESECSNILPPAHVDLSEQAIPEFEASVCFTANTLHIVSWPQVENLFRMAAGTLNDAGRLCVYGPFRFDGEHISESNHQFDQQLRQSDPASGIRDVTELDRVACMNGLTGLEVFPMPANNHILVWQLA